jgi:hypothetical protein
VTSSTRDYSVPASERQGYAWVIYASVMLGLAGTFSVLDAVVGLSKSKFFVADASFVFSDLRTWSWILLVLGALELVAAFRVTSGSELFRWFGVGAASLNGIGQLMALPGYPLWSLAVFAMDLLIVYALVVYGGARLRETA